VVFAALGGLVGLNRNANTAVAMIGLIAGAIGPVIFLRRRRKPPGSTNATDDLNTPPPMPDAQVAAGWHYVTDGKRVGPLTDEAIKKLIRERELTARDTVWRKGMANWKTAAETELGDLFDPTEPPPISGSYLASGTIWALALGPLWITALLYLVGYTYLAYKYGEAYEDAARLYIESVTNKLWGGAFGAYLALAQIDKRILKSGGWPVDRLAFWLILIPPIYIYKRDQLVGQGFVRVIVWAVSAVVAILIDW
jgi:hypothetical protein